MLGSYDEVVILEMPSDATGAAFLASLGSLGEERPQTFRGFSEAEMNEILAKMG